MSTQPEALWLADLIDNDLKNAAHHEAAAAELRRLHEENAELREANETFGRRQVWWNDRMFALEQQRDALLEALKYHQEQTRPIQRTLDVIKAVEEGK